MLRINNLNNSNVIRQGDTKPRKYQLAWDNQEQLNFSGKTAIIKLMTGDYRGTAYQTTATVTPNNEFSFAINDIISAREYYLEVHVDGYVFPSRSLDGKFSVDPSSQGAEASIIEIIGVDEIVQRVLDKVDDSFLDDVEGTVRTNEQVRVSNENLRKTAETTRVTAESARVTAESTRVSQETARQNWYNSVKDTFTRRYAVNIGNNSAKEFTITHNLNTTNVVSQVYLNNEEILPASRVIVNANQIKLTFASVWGTNQLKVVVIG